MKCAKEVGLDINDKNFQNKKEFKCMFKCALEADGCLKNGVLVPDSIIKSLKSDTKLDRNGKEQAAKKVPECVEKVDKQSDLCEKAFGLFECIFTN